ncbi:MAG: hydrolase [Gammaproteobacteria bacterium]|nr:MAG: hydrolase [Gammaproteobacteria bacterium]PHR84621.1 MAG: hydrolase [Colwellia sp.]
MLINSDHSCLLVVDIQEKLISGIHQSEKFIENCQWLIKVAQLFDIPVMASEQYPRGVGPTVAPLRELIPEDCIQDKLIFSCADSPECLEMIEQQKRKQIVIVGMESHVCVLQTALRLNELGKEVFVVADAISSRDPLDIELAIARMSKAGIHIVSREMVAFEWLRGSGAPQFKTFSKEFLQ